MAIKLITERPVCLCVPDLRDACLTNIAEGDRSITGTTNYIPVAGQIEAGSNLVARVDARHARDAFFLELFDRVYPMLHVVPVDAPKQVFFHFCRRIVHL